MRLLATNIERESCDDRLDDALPTFPSYEAGAQASPLEDIGMPISSARTSKPNSSYKRIAALLKCQPAGLTIKAVTTRMHYSTFALFVELVWGPAYVHPLTQK